MFDTVQAAPHPPPHAPWVAHFERERTCPLVPSVCLHTEPRVLSCGQLKSVSLPCEELSLLATSSSAWRSLTRAFTSTLDGMSSDKNSSTDLRLNQINLPLPRPTASHWLLLSVPRARGPVSLGNQAQVCRLAIYMIIPTAAKYTHTAGIIGKLKKLIMYHRHQFIICSITTHFQLYTHAWLQQ